MIKVCEVVRRRPELSVEEFQRHWREVHGPIVARLPGLRRYVQSHPRPSGYRRTKLPYDGLAELWFDDKQGLRAIATTPEFAAAKADEPNFIDPTCLIELVMDEVEPGAYRHGARPEWDGLALTWFDSIDDMRASATTDAFAAVMADGPMMTDPSGTPTPTILTREHVVVG